MDDKIGACFSHYLRGCSDITERNEGGKDFITLCYGGGGV